MFWVKTCKILHVSECQVSDTSILDKMKNPDNIAAYAPMHKNNLFVKRIDILPEHFFRFIKSEVPKISS